MSPSVVPERTVVWTYSVVADPIKQYLDAPPSSTAIVRPAPGSVHIERGNSLPTTNQLDSLSSTFSSEHNGVLLIPGFASTQLYNWRYKDCFPFSYNLADRVWIDVAKVIGAPSCWVECMKLNPEDLSDPPNGCKLRPGEGMTAIGELDPGILTGTLSTIWQEFIRAMVELFDYEPGTTIIAAPYDFRLPPSKLQQRDYFFKSLMTKIETTVQAQNRTRKPTHPGITVIAHSMGNNIFRYFLEWLQDSYPDSYQDWLDNNVAAYVAVGAPFLGAPQILEGILTGVTFGLPRIGQKLAREMAATFGTPSWNLPFHPGEEYGRVWPVDEILTLHLNAEWAKTKKEREAEEARLWEQALLEAADDEIEKLLKDGSQDLTLSAKTRKQHNQELPRFPWRKSFNSSQIMDALRTISAIDEKVNATLNMITKYYLSDPLTKLYKPWPRPPIRKVICAYGINMPTELGYHYTTDVKEGQWKISDTIWEDRDRIFFESTGKVYPSETTKSGDGTVPYASLSWCHHWLDNKSIQETKIPQRFYNRVDTNEDIIIPGEPLITFYESINNKTGATAVWEIDTVDHRDVIKNRVFLREFAEEMLHEHSIYQQAAMSSYGKGPSQYHPSSFATKHSRVPRSDYDCAWDYYAAKCKYSEFCEYRYIFGDLTLDQSCRLKPSLRHRH